MIATIATYIFFICTFSYYKRRDSYTLNLLIVFKIQFSFNLLHYCNSSIAFLKFHLSINFSSLSYSLTLLFFYSFLCPIGELPHSLSKNLDLISIGIYYLLIFNLILYFNTISF